MDILQNKVWYYPKHLRMNAIKQIVITAGTSMGKNKNCHFFVVNGSRSELYRAFHLPMHSAQNKILTNSMVVAFTISAI